MKLVKKWLFPALTCLIVAGAAALPPRISQARDARQFGQVHTEELAADSLPAYEPPSLADRLELYAYRFSKEHPVLSFEDTFYFEQHPQEKEELMQSVEDMLVEAGVIPKWAFEEDPFTELTARSLLLWDPAEDSSVQKPATFYWLTWENHDKLHNKIFVVYTDGETDLPIDIYIHDTNISQWLPYEAEPLRELAGRYFELLGMDVREVDADRPYEPWHTFYYELTDTAVRYSVHRQPTSVTIELDTNWHGESTSGTTDGYDG